MKDNEKRDVPDIFSPLLGLFILMILIWGISWAVKGILHTWGVL